MTTIMRNKSLAKLIVYQHACDVRILQTAWILRIDPDDYQEKFDAWIKTKQCIAYLDGLFHCNERAAAGLLMPWEVTP